ncbi:PREDICTED: F-box protein At2g02240-like [Ipomoea nil]|uniref:F-box protein At2g02240-like n=1 Tax=Ipomoea nil TaxID=35883 RepID=UPI000901609B|nr:PREDICTED: F-box protein At2g02240-like [Ipomoea nil]
MDFFASLPEGLISDIISLTSAVDAARLSVISRVFKAAAESDSVWGRFLPQDLSDILLRSRSPVVFSNMKELYFTLCNSPILLDDGSKLSFSLDKSSGKKCFMIAARELDITWGNKQYYWELKPHPDSRFSEVANLRSVCWLDIRGVITTNMLSATTDYAAYLVFRLSDMACGLESAKSLVRFVSQECDEEAENRADGVSLFGGQSNRRGGSQTSNELRRERSDGWMEVELGSFYNDQGDDGDVEARLIEIWDLNWKSGLIVEGIEFRPKS